MEAKEDITDPGTLPSVSEKVAAEENGFCTDIKDIKEKVLEEDSALPYQDHGAAWLPVFGLFIVCFSMAGTLKSFGVIYIGLLELYEAGELTTSLASAAQSVSVVLSTLVVGCLIDKAGVKLMVVLGGFISVIGFTISSFGPNIYFTIVGYGLFVGVGIALFDTPLLAAVGQYWKKRITLANGVAFTGSSIGVMVLPLLFNYFIQQYGVKGTFLLTGGIWAQICVGGMLLRRPPKYPSESQNNTEKEPKTPNNPGQHLGGPEHDPPQVFQISKNEYQKNGEIKIEYHQWRMKPQSRNRNSTNGSEIPVPGETNVPKNGSHFDGEKRPKVLGYKALFTNIAFLRFFVMLFLSGVSCLGIIFMLPSLGRERGADDYTSAFTVTTVGIGEIMSRVPFGICIDRFHVKRVWFLAACFLIAGSCGIATVLYKNVVTLFILSASIGAFGNMYIPLMIPTMTDCITPELYGKGSSILVCVFNISIAISSLIIGKMSETSGSYEGSLFVFTLMMFAVALLGLLDVFVVSIKRLSCFRTRGKFTIKQ